MIRPTPISELRPASHPPIEASAGGFVSDLVVEAWIRRGQAKREGGALILEDGRRLDVTDALRVLGRRNGDTDPYGWTGRVLSLRELVSLGATIGPGAAKLGAVVYDVEFGLLVGAPRD